MSLVCCLLNGRARCEHHGDHDRLPRNVSHFLLQKLGPARVLNIPYSIGRKSVRFVLSRQNRQFSEAKSDVTVFTNRDTLFFERADIRMSTDTKQTKLNETTPQHGHGTQRLQIPYLWKVRSPATERLIN